MKLNNILKSVNNEVKTLAHSTKDPGSILFLAGVIIFFAISQ